MKLTAAALTFLLLITVRPVGAASLDWTFPANQGAILKTGGAEQAELAVVRVMDDGTSVPARLQSRTIKAGKVREVWALDTPAIDTVLEYTPLPSLGATKIHLIAVNRSSAKAHACIALQLIPKYTVDRAIEFDFTKAPYVEFAFGDKGISGASWKAEKDLNAQKGLYGFPNRGTVFDCWGTAELCNPLSAKDSMCSTLYLPIVSLYNDKTGGLVAWCDPRSPIGFDGNHEHLRLQHTFFLPAGKGTEDKGFNPGDGTGPWPYDLYIAYSSHPTWDKLYAAYMQTAPDLRDGRPAKAGPGIVALVRATDDYLPIFKRLGIKYTSGDSITYSDPDGVTLDEVKWARKHGVYYFAQDGTIGMASDLSKSPVPPWEPQWIVERYESSLIKDKNGNTEWCWQGKFANPSPHFPFGRDRFAALKDLFKQPYGAFYIDLYLSSAGSDWAHPVDAMAFYLMQRAYYEYLSAVAKQTRKRGMFFNINAPQPSCLVGKYADWMTFDTDAPIWLMGHTYGALTGIPVQFWTNLQDTVPKLEKSLSEALAYGVISGPYSSFPSLLPTNTSLSPEVREELIDIYQRHYKLAYAIGMSQLVKGTTTDGKPGPFLYYRGKDGTGYITIQNFSDTRQTVTVPLELSALGFPPDRGARIALWDINRGLGSFASLKSGSTTEPVNVGAGLTSVIVLRPEASAKTK